MRATAKIVGSAHVARTFAQMEKSARGEVLETALTAGALLVANRWKENAPYKTGQYRRSIHVGGHTDQTPDFEGDDLGGNVHSATRAEVVIGTAITDPPYPRWLEDGTSRMSARPSAQPAFDETKAAALKEVHRALKILVTKAAK